ncbi:MAG: DNA polymerase IV [Dehalococcoidia bacterium]
MDKASLRYIALVDLDAFFASVEMLEQPELEGKPVLIGGPAKGRGVVAAASYEARKYGCHSAMPMARAIRLCPHAVVLPSRHRLYRQYSERVMDILQRESHLLQQVSIDEAYVDLTPVAASMAEAEALAHRMRARVRLEVGLPCSIGLASSKMVAKVACETGKPNGFVAVAPGQEAAFLAELDISALPGIGPRTAMRLRSQGFSTLGQIAQEPMARLMTAIGPWGALLQRRALGEDSSPVRIEREAKSISAEETFAEDVTEREVLENELRRLSERVGGSLAEHGLVGRTVTLKLRSADFTTITRSASRASATASVQVILSEAIQLLDEHWRAGEPVRLIGVGASNLRPVLAPGQLPMQQLMAQLES